MHSILSPIVAAAVAAGGLTLGAVLAPPLAIPAHAAKASKARPTAKRVVRSRAAATTGFEHQQCSVQNPCSTRNQW